MIAGFQETTTAAFQVGTGGVSLVDVAQFASAIGTLVLAGAVWFQVKAAREQAASTHATVAEMRESRRAQERPQVMVDLDHSDPPFVFVVVRNIGRGAAKNITFAFSADMESPSSADPNSLVVPMNHQPYFRRGLPYLAPGAEIPNLWGSMSSLAQFLRDRGLQDGITITCYYQSLSGDPYEAEWTVNPLLVAGRLSIGSKKSLQEIAEATEKLSAILDKVVNPLDDTLRVTTETERQQRDQVVSQTQDFLKQKLRAASPSVPGEAVVTREEIESLGPNPRTAIRLFELYNDIHWHGEFDMDPSTGEWTSFRVRETS